jgi:hypothetical protein
MGARRELYSETIPDPLAGAFAIVREDDCLWVELTAPGATVATCRYPLTPGVTRALLRATSSWMVRVVEDEAASLQRGQREADRIIAVLHAAKLLLVSRGTLDPPCDPDGD